MIRKTNVLSAPSWRTWISLGTFFIFAADFSYGSVKSSDFPALARWKGDPVAPDLAKMIDRVGQLEHEDHTHFIQHLIQAYEKKCSPQRFDNAHRCFLTEKDLFSDVQLRDRSPAFRERRLSEDRVLMFSGEEINSDMPGTSSLVKYVLSEPNFLCRQAESCNIGRISHRLLSVLSDPVLSSLDVKSLVIDGGSGQWDKAPLNSTDNGSISLLSPLQILSLTHLLDRVIGVRVANKEVQRILNPMVPFSVSPGVAENYARLYAGDTGRRTHFFILSVPKSRFLEYREDRCGAVPVSHREAINLYACNVEFSFNYEAEYNFLFHMPSDLLRDVIFVNPASTKILNYLYR